MRCFKGAVLVLFLAALAAGAQDKPESNSGVVEAAEKATQTWLALTDAGQYGESWDQASQYFQSKLTRQQWIQALEKVRTPLGKMQTRKLKSATYTQDVPNAPKGEYVIIQYDTSFQNMPSAIETVTTMREKDGSWKVSGYFIKPAE